MRREGQDDGIDADLVEARRVGGARLTRRTEDRRTGEHAEHAAGGYEQPVFDEQLANQAPSAAADSGANAELVRACRAPVQAAGWRDSRWR